MFGIGYQEVLILLVIFGMYFLLLPPIVYLLARIFLKALKSPRRALLAFWMLAIVVAALVYATDRDLTAFILTSVVAPLGIAFNLTLLWLAGYMWQGVGLARMGREWRSMAALLFRAVRPVSAR